MSAEVFGDGQAEHLMEIWIVEEAHHIHLHFLTNEEEYSELGYAKVEFCCHGCGESFLVYFRNTTRSSGLHRRAKEDFISQHRSCKDLKFPENCSNYRSSFKCLDLRGLSRVQAQKRALHRKKERSTKLSS